AAAGGHALLALARDEDREDAAASARRDHRGDGHRFRADSEGIGGVLHVAPRMDAVLVVEHRSTHVEARVGRMGAVLHLARRVEQALDLLVVERDGHDQCSFTQGLPSAAGATLRPMNPARSSTVSTYGSAWS